MNIYQTKENLNLAINACKGIGLKLPGIKPDAFIEKKPHLILAVMWQVMRLCLTKRISLKDCPEIMRLAGEGESLQDLLKLTPEAILIRWINFHLKKIGVDRKINNLGQDLKDSTAILQVLNSLDKEKCNLAGLNESDLVRRADIAIKNAESIGTPALVRPADIVSGNSKLLTIFVAELFNTRHGLEELNEEEKEAFQKFGIDDDDVEGTREERAFRFWINSLNIDDVYIDDLYGDCDTGLVLLKVLDKLSPGCVDWKTVDKNPNNTFKKGINCNQIVTISVKKLGLKLPGISGQDFVDKKKKLILAVVWQLVRFNYMKIIGGTTEDDLVKWANGLVQGDHKIKNLKDKQMSDGHFLLQVCNGIEPRAIDWDIVKKGEEEDDKANNAKYIISIVRKLGGTLFCIWEDIVKVEYKQIFILFATLFEIHQQQLRDAGK